jgi:exodeoxyribonuclease-5
VQLTSEQQGIVDALASNMETMRFQRLGGYAGTGKTVLVRALAEMYPTFAVCAYTGKAAHVLRRKGCAATTIHSLIYMPADNSVMTHDAREQLKNALNAGAPQWGIDALMGMVSETKKPRFVLRDKLTRNGDQPVDGIIVDEASMVPRRIHEDLLMFGVPVIYVGDHGQLPPVSDKQDAFNLMEDPDYRLEKIHRNAGPIAYFAQHLRGGGQPRGYASNGNTLRVLGRGSAKTDLLKTADQVIAPYNKSRCEFNRKIKFALCGVDDQLIEGDRIICLRNDYAVGLFNGQQGTVTSVDAERLTLDFEDDDGQLFADVEFVPDQFYQEKYAYQRGGPHPFDFAYVVTCHKAQGSEWPHVVVLDQGGQREYSRWAYTAASRASERLTWITNTRDA